MTTADAGRGVGSGNGHNAEAARAMVGKNSPDLDESSPRPTPAGSNVHKIENPVESLKWLQREMGQRGLSGALLRGGVPVFCPRVGEKGYVEPKRPGDDNGPAMVRPLSVPRLQVQLAKGYQVGRFTAKAGWSEMLFPAEVAALALAEPDELANLRPLNGVTHTPLVRADGSILTAPGYDAASGFLHLPTVELSPVPDNPTAEQLAATTAWMRRLVGEFPWLGAHDEANFFGALITPLLRELCPPPYKLIAFMARQPGSGKSLLARILRIVHGGVLRCEMPADDAELDKALVSILSQTTAPVCEFDNVSGILRSSRLAGLLTSREYSGRLLGSTNETPMVNDRLWTITGNNLNLGGDLVRRSLWITIDPRVPDPQKRTGFAFGDLAGYVRAERRWVLHSLLVWAAAWRAAGCPRPPAESTDDYGPWIATVRGILGVAGVPGTFDHAESAQQKTGVDDEGWSEFLAALAAVFGAAAWTVRDVIDRMNVPEPSGYNPTAEQIQAHQHAQTLTDALPGPLHDKWLRNGTAGVSRSLGMWLRNRNGRWTGGLVSEEAGRDKVRNVPLWGVRGTEHA